MEILVNIINIVFGLIICFLGYKYSKVLISLTGAVAGYVLANALLESLITNNILLVIVSILIGVVIGLISFKLYQIGIFIICFILVCALVYNLVPITNELLLTILSIVAGIVAGVVGVMFTKYGIIISTAISGAGSTLGAIGSLIKINETIIFILALILAIIGIIYQIKTTKDKEPRTKES